MPQYEALVHVFWELPFALRLPPHAFYCWEPGEGVAINGDGVEIPRFFFCLFNRVTCHVKPE